MGDRRGSIVSPARPGASIPDARREAGHHPGGGCVRFALVLSVVPPRGVLPFGTLNTTPHCQMDATRASTVPDTNMSPKGSTTSAKNVRSIDSNVVFEIKVFMCIGHWCIYLSAKMYAKTSMLCLNSRVRCDRYNVCTMKSNCI